jgi:hypothetical protein
MHIMIAQQEEALQCNISCKTVFMTGVNAEMRKTTAAAVYA